MPVQETKKFLDENGVSRLATRVRNFVEEKDREILDKLISFDSNEPNPEKTRVWMPLVT